jgi:quercetin dioxygenase-like cupin family protein
MDVRSVDQTRRQVEHHGQVDVWYMYRPREAKESTLGGYLEIIDEFQISPGGEVNPHSHHTLEFYYILAGRGIMTLKGEERMVHQGDLITIPPDAVHSLKTFGDQAPVRVLTIGIGLKDTPEVDYSNL